MTHDQIALAAPFANTLLGLLLAWLFGTRVSIGWNLRQKRRESLLASAAQFHSLYGRFLSLGKRWNLTFAPSDIIVGETSKRRAELVAAAVIAEGELEALLVKLASECNLTEENIADLGRYREGYQELRRTMVEGQALSWFAQPFGRYTSFKALAARVAATLADDATLTKAAVTPAQAEARLARITSNEHQQNWFDIRRS